MDKVLTPLLVHSENQGVASKPTIVPTTLYYYLKLRKLYSIFLMLWTVWAILKKTR